MLQKLDDEIISFCPAVEIAALSEKQQKELLVAKMCIRDRFWTIHKKILPDEDHGSVKAVHHFLSWYSKFFHVSYHSNDPDEKKEFLSYMQFC